jgi:hypothetical protein
MMGKPVIYKTVRLSLTEEEWKQFYAYAYVKGFGTNAPIAALARTAIISQIARNAPTAIQKERIEQIIEKLS